jgi:hypothetical protein
LLQKNLRSFTFYANTNFSIRAQSCGKGCSFEKHIDAIAVATFNIKARNVVSEANDRIRAENKEATTQHKKSSAARKLKKLSSV